MEETMQTVPKCQQHIVIVDRGWVYVGKVEREPEYLRVTNARVIRYWGTKRGLGELAEGGPTRDTKLDPIGTVLVPHRAVISLVECKHEW